MFKIFRETNSWILRYSGWRYAVPALLLSFVGWMAAEIIFWADQREEGKLFESYSQEMKNSSNYKPG